MTAPAPGGAPAPPGPPLSGGSTTVSNVHYSAPVERKRRRLPKPGQTAGEARLSELADGCIDEAALFGSFGLSQGLGQDY